MNGFTEIGGSQYAVRTSQPITTVSQRVQVEIIVSPDELEALPANYRNLTDLLLEKALHAIHDGGVEPRHLEADDDCHWHVLRVESLEHKPAANAVVFLVEVTYR